jgi:3-oxoacyl-ACP reductase-like protein
MTKLAAAEAENNTVEVTPEAPTLKAPASKRTAASPSAAKTNAAAAAATATSKKGLVKNSLLSLSLIFALQERVKILNQLKFFLTNQNHPHLLVNYYSLEFR